MSEIHSDFMKEEIRCDHLVTEKMKRIWATQLRMLENFDAICKRHNLKYFAGYGTLLGAVRHRGYIPWDDDIDVVMFRDEYEKLKTVVEDELEEHYFFQDVYSDNMIFTFSKIRDSRTTAFEEKWGTSPETNHGIFIDIFPFDDVYKIENPNIYEIQREIWGTIVMPGEIVKVLSRGEKLLLDSDILIDFLSAPVRDRMREFENFNCNHFGQTEYINHISDEFCDEQIKVKREWYEETLYVPFEYTTIPIPAQYDKVLKAYYGDYSKFVKGTTMHEGIVLDPDKPYKQYLAERFLVK